MSLDLDPSVEHDLSELAALKNVSVNALLREFTAEQKRYWKERAADEQRLADMREGGGVSQEDMSAHFDDLREAAKARL